MTIVVHTTQVHIPSHRNYFHTYDVCVYVHHTAFACVASTTFCGYKKYIHHVHNMLSKYIQ